MNLAQCSYLPRCARAMRECAEMEPGIRHIHFEHWFKCFL
jgi:ABC-type dipeptide/oligopeptide/nickel transport system ATPase component